MANLAGLAILIVLSIIGCEAQSWEAFQKKHVLNPNDYPSYGTWNRAQWNDFLRTRIDDYGTKSLNSIIISHPNAVAGQFTFTNPKHNSGDYYWASQKLPMYAMQRNVSTYEAYNCPSLFVLAALDSATRPLHFHAMQTTQQTTGNINFSVPQNCNRIP